MNIVLLKLFASYVFYSEKFNKWGTQPDDNAQLVLTALTLVLQIGFVFCITLTFYLGDYVFKNIFILPTILALFVVVNYFFWGEIKRKYEYEKKILLPVNYRLFYWGSLTIVALVFITLISLPILVKIIW